MQISGLSRRILVRLEQAEVCELNPHFRDDRRIAWITVLNAWRGSSLPHSLATHTVLGRYPDEVWPWIVAWRKAKLGNEYSAWYDDAGNLRPDSPLSMRMSPKKPVQMDLRFNWHRDAA